MDHGAAFIVRAHFAGEETEPQKIRNVGKAAKLGNNTQGSPDLSILLDNQPLLT